MGANESHPARGSPGGQQQRTGTLQLLVEDPWKTLGLVYYPGADDSDDEDTDIDQVLDGLYVGGMEGAMDKRGLLKAGITHILNVASYKDYPKAYHGTEFEYLVLAANDLPTENIKKYFRQTNEFIAKGRRRGAVYVHCYAGMSRAPTVAVAYLMAEQGMDLKEAASTVKAARRQAMPNRGFWSQLEEYANELAVKTQSPPSEPRSWANF